MALAGFTVNSYCPRLLWLLRLAFVARRSLCKVFTLALKLITMFFGLRHLLCHKASLHAAKLHFGNLAFSSGLLAVSSRAFGLSIVDLKLSASSQRHQPSLAC